MLRCITGALVCAAAWNQALAARADSSARGPAPPLATVETVGIILSTVLTLFVLPS